MGVASSCAALTALSNNLPKIMVGASRSNPDREMVTSIGVRSPDRSTAHTGCRCTILPPRELAISSTAGGSPENLYVVDRR